MFRDERRCKVREQICQRDLRAFAKVLSPAVFAEAAAQARVAVGAGPLCWPNMVWLGVASALHYTKAFADLLGFTIKLLTVAPEFSSSWLRRQQQAAKRKKLQGEGRSKHDPYGGDPTVVSDAAFSKARQAMPLEYWMAVLLVLGRQFQTQHDKRIRYKGFRLLAIDGSCFSLPSHRALITHYGTAQNGSKKWKKKVNAKQLAKGNETVQARMVMLQFPLVRLPYRYEISPLAVGEKELAGRLLNDLQTEDLVLLDRGFWSFELFWAVQNQGAFFGTRMVKGPRWKTRKKLGPGDRIARWTPSDTSRAKWKNRDLPKSIDLRIIRYQIPGFRASAIVTNVNDPQRLSREDWVRLAADCESGRGLQPGLYHRRWEIETTFRELKVTQKIKGGIRGRTPKAIEYEIAGHVLLYLLVRWLIVEAGVEYGLDPLRISFKHALEELRDLHHELVKANRQRIARFLLPLLLARIAEHLVEARPGRHFPRPNDTKTKNKGYGLRQRPAKLRVKQG
jgi:hypothetical protein